MSVGDHVIAPVDERPRACHALEREAAAHRGADLDRVVAARSPHELDGPALEERVDVDLLDRGEHAGELADGDHRAEVVERMAVELRVDDRQLLLERRVAERGAGSGSGRAGPRAAGTFPPARSCSRSRRRRTGRAARA